MTIDIWDFGPLVPHGSSVAFDAWVNWIGDQGQPTPLRCYVDRVGQYHPYAPYAWRLIALCVAGVAEVAVSQ
jgi:hypothetical protein